MSNQVKGIVETVKDNGPSQGKYGKQYRVSILVDGEWYGGFFKKSAEDMGLDEGRLVQFNYTQNGEYLNIDPKTLQVSKQAAAPASQASAPRTGNQSGTAPAGKGDRGIKVGHAINNAVQLAIAKGDTNLATIHKFATQIIALGVKLEGQFDQVVAASESVLAKAREEAQAAEPASVPAPAAPAPRRQRAPAKPKEEPKAPAPAPEPEPEFEPVEEANEPAPEPQFDDDIPF